jgi:hypothetical protein
MGNIDKYLELIKHNSKLLDLITGNRPEHLTHEDFSDWQVTVMFYISCIYLKAVCTLHNIDIQDHHKLRETINTNQSLKKLWNISKDYRHIEESSRDARYEGRKFDKNNIERLLRKFYNVRDCAIGIIKDKGINNVPIIDLSFLSGR